MKILSYIDLQQNEIQNAVVQNLSSAPRKPLVGQVYFDTTLNLPQIWNGTVWLSAAVTTLSALTDCNAASGATAGQTLTYSASGTWIPKDLPGSLIGVVKSSGQLVAPNLTVGSQVILTAPAISNGKIGALKKAVISSSIPLKVELQSDGVTVYTMFTSVFAPTIKWKEIVFGEFIGTTGFSVQLTNQSSNDVADCYGTLCWTEN